MRILSHTIKGALCGAAFLSAAAAGAASAATIDFGTSSGDLSTYSEDGFDLAPARLVNGNCLDGACLNLSSDQTTTLTSQDGGLFTLDSLSFNLLGRPSELTVTGSNGATTTFMTSVFGQGSYNTVSFNSLFAGVTSVLFENTGNGSVRVDDIELAGVELAPIPLPAAGLLLLGGIGALGLIGRLRRPQA